MAKHLAQRFILFCTLLSVQVFCTSYLVFTLVLQDERSQAVALLVFLLTAMALMVLVAAASSAMANLYLKKVSLLAERLKEGVDQEKEVDETLPGEPEMEEVLKHFNRLVRQWKSTELELFLIGGIFDELHRMKNDDSPFQVFRLLNQIMDGLKKASHFNRLMVLLREEGGLTARLALGYAQPVEGVAFGFGEQNTAIKEAFTGRRLMRLENTQAVASGLGEYTQRLGGAAAAVVAPLWNRGEIMGFFVADTPDPQPLDEGRLHALLMLTNFLGFTFEKLEILRQIRNLANFDETTRAYNRKYFLSRLEEEVKKAGRYKQEFALLLIRINPYDTMVKEQGYEKGEDLARLVAAYVMAHVREVDLLCRYQEDAFLLLLPATGAEGSAILGGRLQENLSGTIRSTGGGQAPPVTVTAVMFPDQGTTIDTLLHALMQQPHQPAP